MASQGKQFKSKHTKITFNSTNKRNKIHRRFREDDSKIEEPFSTIAFLQPEVLPLDLMKDSLILRGAGDDIKKSDSLEEIIKLFYKHITPKPQRRYRQNRKGKILLKSQRKKEKQKGSEEKETFTIMGSESKSSVSNSSIESRLKPPVDRVGEKKQQICIDPSRKKIKLSNSSNSLDKIHIVKRKKSEVEENKFQASKNSSQNVQSDTGNDADPKKKKKKVAISWP